MHSRDSCSTGVFRIHGNYLITPLKDIIQEIMTHNAPMPTCSVRHAIAAMFTGISLQCYRVGHTIAVRPLISYREAITSEVMKNDGAEGQAKYRQVTPLT